MKKFKIFLRLAVVLLAFTFALIPAMAQVPQALNYQAVARDASGHLIASHAVGLKIIIHQTSATGTIVYSETFSPTTNQFGLFTVSIGTGNPVTGTFSSIAWSSGNYWMQVQLDATGGTTYVDMGTSQLLSVPYALYAASSGTPGATGATGATGITGATGATGLLSNGTAAGNTSYWDGSQWVLNNNNIYNNGANVGIGTSSPASKLDLNGSIKITDGTEGKNKILTSDSTGKASWQKSDLSQLLSSFTPDFSCLNRVNTISTGLSPQSIVISGNYAYMVESNSNDLKIFDISTHATPVLISTTATGVVPNCVAVSGNYAYIVDRNTNDLIIFDISIPSAPVLQSTTATGTLPFGVAVSVNYACVVDNTSEDMKIFDVSNPAAPVLKSTTSTGSGSGPWSIAASGNYAFVVDFYFRDLKIFNISDPTAPVLTSTTATGNGPISVTVSGNYVYVTDLNDNDFRIYDISNPSAPVLKSTTSTGNSPWSITVEGNYAYTVNNADNNMQIFDISNPVAPVLKTTTSTGSGPISSAVSGNYAYVVDAASNDMMVFQLTCSPALVLNPLSQTISGNPLSNLWTLIGNSNITANNFIGTTNNSSLFFKVNGVKSGALDPAGPVFLGLYAGNTNTATTNTGIGSFTLPYNTTGNNNTASGYSSLYANTTGYNNTALGVGSLFSNTTASHNIAIGSSALFTQSFSNSNTPYLTNNVAVGDSALYFNQPTTATNGIQNIAIGSLALYSNTSGYYNIANGFKALYSNTTASGNIAIGVEALKNQSFSFGNVAYYSNNVAIGNLALYSNQPDAPGHGASNTAVGSASLYSNTTGYYNTANGVSALGSNTTGYYNTAVGVYSLFENTTGKCNTAVGYNSLYNNIAGSYNTTLGYNAYPVTGQAFSNYTSIGYYAGSSSSSNNSVEIGNSSVGWIGGQVGWSTYSDERIKDNIKSDVPGLAFISLLNPVTYNINIHRENDMVYKGKDSANWTSKYDIEKVKMTGFLAQQVAEAAKKSGYDFSGVHIPSDTTNGLYSLRYSDFVVPLVKAVQELNTKNEIQQTIITTQNTKIETLQHQIDKQQKEIDELKALIKK